jgi:UDPglucose 6-dehydrogenase
LVTAACFAELGHTVSLLEIDAEKVSALRGGVLPISEPGLPELWQRNWREGRLGVTSDCTQGLLGTEFAFIAVGTPSTSNGKPDLKSVRSAAKSIAEVSNGLLTVVIKSTVPMGTADMVAEILTRYAGNEHGFLVVSNPEFLREGMAVFDFMHPTRIVVGASNRSAAAAVAELYQALDSPTIICDNRTAEMSKYASNVFLATRISFMNEIALLCDKYGVDVVQVAEIMGLDPRFGAGYLSAGLGWGGSCLPKDIRGLISMAKSCGVALPLIRAVQQINEQQPCVAVQKLHRLIGSLEGKTVGVLGLSFKPNSDDIREASALSVIRRLNEEGCHVKAYDPLAMAAVARLIPEVTYCANAYEAARGSDALILVTEWNEFKKLDMSMIAGLMNRPVLVDGRNLYDPEEMIQAGFIYEGIGRCGIRQRQSEAMPLSDTKKAM